MKETIEAINDNLCSRLNRLVREKGYNIPRLSKKTGVTEGTIHRILTSQHSNPTYTTLKAISDALEISIGELLGEIDPATPNSRRIKIVPWEKILDTSETSDNFISSNVNVSTEAFAVKLNSSHMLPLFPENSILIFDPNKKCYDRAYVLVKLNNHPIPIFKQLIIDEPNWYIKSLSSELHNENLTQLDSADRIIATLTQSQLSY